MPGPSDFALPPGWVEVGGSGAAGGGEGAVTGSRESSAAVADSGWAAPPTAAPEAATKTTAPIAPPTTAPIAPPTAAPAAPPTAAPIAPPTGPPAAAATAQPDKAGTLSGRLGVGSGAGRDCGGARPGSCEPSPAAVGSGGATAPAAAFDDISAFILLTAEETRVETINATIARPRLRTLTKSVSSGSWRFAADTGPVS